MKIEIMKSLTSRIDRFEDLKNEFQVSEANGPVIYRGTIKDISFENPFDVNGKVSLEKFRVVRAISFLPKPKKEEFVWDLSGGFEMFGGETIIKNHVLVSPNDTYSFEKKLTIAALNKGIALKPELIKLVFGPLQQKLLERNTLILDQYRAFVESPQIELVEK